MAGPANKRPANKPTAGKTKKKTVHVVPKAKIVGKTKSTMSKVAASRGLQQVKRTKSDGVQRGAYGTAVSGLQWVENGTADQQTVKVPLMTGRDGESEASEPVPYNTRIPSSTPNTTLQHDVRPTPKPSSKPAGFYNAGERLFRYGGRIVEYQCAHGKKKNTAELPLVVLNPDYSATPGQDNPLNATDQVNIRTIAPGEERNVSPRVFPGRVEFQPNPAAWFHPEKPATDPGLVGYVNVPVQDFAEPVDFSLYSNPVVPEPLLTSVRADEGSVPERPLSTSLHSNPNTVTGSIHIPVVSSQSVSLQRSPNNSQTAVKPPAIQIPTAEQPSKPQRTVKTKKVKPEHKLRMIPKETPCPRCAKSDKKKQSLRNKENIQKKIPESQLKQDGGQCTISDAATQCSPEKPTKEYDDPVTVAEPLISQQALRHMRTLQHLLSQMKAMAKTAATPHLEELVTQVEQTAGMFVPGLGGIDWRTELELAIQPLRCENAQLRRRLRINNQQMKDKSHQLELVEKPDPNYQTVHLELLRHKLETDYREMKSSRDQTRDRLLALQAELDHLRGERAKLLQIMVNKDTDLQQAEAGWATDITRYRTDADQSRAQLTRLHDDRNALHNQVELLKCSVEQRDDEISRLRDVVKNLQRSMTQLLNQLKTMTPPDDFVDPFVDERGNSLLDENSLDRDSLLDRTPTNEPNGPTTQPSPPSARRALPFSPQKPAYSVAPPRGGWGNSLDVTDYIVAPGTSPIKPRPGLLEDSVTPRSDATTSTTPTVKELLTPLKDRMQSQYKRMSVGSPRVAGTTTAVAIEVVPEEVSTSDPDPSPLEVDTTLLGSLNSTEDDGEVTPAPAQTFIEEASRYSMTDYFKKYSNKLEQKLDDEQLSEGFEPKEGERSDSPVSPQRSFQDEGFRGTELDTSLSTIDDTTTVDDSASLVSLLSGTSVGSTIDESAFQQGLADLDANIARIQADLKLSIAGSFPSQN